MPSKPSNSHTCARRMRSLGSQSHPCQTMHSSKRLTLEHAAFGMGQAAQKGLRGHQTLAFSQFRRGLGAS